MPQGKAKKKRAGPKIGLRQSLSRSKVPAEKKAKKEVKVDTEKEKAFDPWKVLKYPHLAEKSMNMVELENKLVFMVHRRATKAEVKEAVEKGFGVKVISVNLEITRKGQKKAYIKLAPNFMAADIASRLGMV